MSAVAAEVWIVYEGERIALRTLLSQLHRGVAARLCLGLLRDQVHLVIEGTVSAEEAIDRAVDILIVFIETHPRP